MGRNFETAKMALSDIDEHRFVPVLQHQGASYSGFHQGAGETTITELLQTDLPKYSLVLIDEVETSLHPRAQRRLVRDLAERARELELQIILTTHSLFVLDELPFEARAHIAVTDRGRRTVIYGVSPEFAMSKIDDVTQFECDLYVEDARAKTLLIEVLARHAPPFVSRCQVSLMGQLRSDNRLESWLIRDGFLANESCSSTAIKGIPSGAFDYLKTRQSAWFLKIYTAFRGKAV